MKPNYFKRFFHDTKKYFKYTIESAKAELKAEVANSFLNWIWWILEPFCFMLIYSFVYGFVFKAKEDYFNIFIFIGISMWTFFQRMLKQSVTIVKVHKPIISKVYLPKFIFLYVKTGVNGFKMMMCFIIVIVMMIVYQVPVSWRLIFAIPILVTLALLSFGLSCFLLHLGVYISDMSNIIDIFLRMMIYATGIFYSVSRRIPAPYGNLLTKVNPLGFLLDAMRKVLIYNQTPSLKVFAFWFVFSVVLCILGVYVVYRNENSYVKSI